MPHLPVITASSRIVCLHATHTYEQFSHTGRPSANSNNLDVQSTGREHFAHVKLINDSKLETILIHKQ